MSSTAEEKQNPDNTATSDHSLYVAQFLTNFQSYYTGKPGPPITTNDLERAIDYRIAFERHERLENEFESMEEKSDEWKDAVDNSRTVLDAFEQRSKDVHFLLRRFEIWSTKALASHCLMNCCKSRNSEHHTEILCNSTLLNLPGSMHFSQILPPLSPEYGVKGTTLQDHGKNHPCSLPVPPNSATWREYFRLARMVSLLPTPNARIEAYQSHLTGVNPKLQSTREDAKILESAKFSQADLVALWCRAQRNTSGLRHLLHLFTVTEKPVESKWKVTAAAPRNGGVSVGKTLVREELEPAQEEERELTYVAKFVGNHKHTRAHVLFESHLVDQLVNWAVTNQVLFTFPYVREALKRRQKKRRRTSESNKSRPTKRTRHVEPDGEQDADSELQILHACQCFLLRWFARRNRKTLSIIFNAHPANLSDSSNAALISELVQADVPQKISKQVKRSGGGTNRTLARIDRRIPLGIFEATEEGHKTFYVTVTDLLKALLVCTQQTSLHQNQVRSALTDFDLLHKYMKSFQTKGALAVGRAMTNGENVAELLQSCPAPFMDHCAECNEKIIESQEIRVCDNCQVPRHETCCNLSDQKVKLSEIVLKCPPLKKLYSVHIPRDLTPPDYREDGSVTFTEHIIDVARRVSRDANGEAEMSPLGMSIRQTEQCHLSLRRYLAQDKLAFDALEPAEIDYPFAVNDAGVVVVGVNDGISKAAGIRESDIITHIEFMDEGNRKKHTMSGLSFNRRLQLFREPIKNIRLTVQRPDINLVKTSQKWLGGVIKANRAAANAFLSWDNKTGRDLYVCANCCGDSAVQTESEEERVVREARYCRAVLRFLGMEWCSRPFHDESPPIDTIDDAAESVSSRHERYISFRRLDSMLSRIISDHSQDFRRNRHSSHVDPFTVPPWDPSHLHKERLTWAPVELDRKPLDLLCRGMELILAGRQQVAPGGNMHRQERAALTSMFVSLVTAWCWTPFENGSAVKTCGPPLSAMRAKEPWLPKSCVACAVRPQHTGDAESSTFCDNESCRQLLDDVATDLGDMSVTTMKELSGDSSTEDTVGKVDDKQEKELGEECDSAGFMEFQRKNLERQIREYEHYSSFVGTSLLVLPGDPCLEYVSKALNMSIDHLERPMELLVVSYTPPGFCDGDRGKKGFCIIPILQQTQLQFVLETCTMRKPPQDLHNKDRSWTKLDVLNLPGVIRLSYAELRKKVRETNAIRAAIDEAVAEFAMCSSREEIESLKKSLVAGEIGMQAILPCRDVITSPKYATGVEDTVTQQEGKSTLYKMREYGQFPIDSFVELRGSTTDRSAEVKRESCANYSTLIDCVFNSAVPLVRHLVARVDTGTVTQSTCGGESLVLGAEDDTDIEDSDIEFSMAEQESPSSNNTQASPRGEGAVVTSNMQMRRAHRPSRTHSGVSDYANSSQVPHQAHGYRSYYSDFFLGLKSQVSASMSARLEQALKGQELLNPPLHDKSYFMHNIILHRVSYPLNAVNDGHISAEAASRGFTGWGWGFELVRWKSERGRLRVGRIFPDSVAAKAGLKMHDIISSINGRSIGTFSNVKEMANAILGFKSQDAAATPALLSIDGPVTGPTVLRLYRSSHGTAPDTPEKHAINGYQQSPPMVDQSRQEESQVKEHAAFSPLNSGTSSVDTSKETNASQGNAATFDSAGRRVPQFDLVIGPQQERSVAPRVPEQQRNAGAIGDPHYDGRTHVDQAGNREISRVDLFQPSGLPNCFLTRVEAAFLIEAARRNCCKLGMRLLCPRYSLDLVKLQWNVVFASDCSSIPRVPEKLWSNVMKYDYERSTKESGPIAFHEGEYSYRHPTDILPLDRIAESFARWNRQRPSSQMLRETDPTDQTVPMSTSPQSQQMPVPDARSPQLVDGKQEWASTTRFSNCALQQNDMRGELAPRLLSTETAVSVGPQPTATYQPIVSPKLPDAATDAPTQRDSPSHGSNTQNYTLTPSSVENVSIVNELAGKNGVRQQIDTPNPFTAMLDETVKGSSYEPASLNSPSLSEGHGDVSSMPSAPLEVHLERRGMSPSGYDDEIVIDLTSSDKESNSQMNTPHSLRIRGGGYSRDIKLSKRRSCQVSHPDRIRGGGTSIEGCNAQNEEASASQKLEEAPPESWNNTFVFGFCATTRDGFETGEAKYIGLVDTAEKQGGTVDVRIFYFSNVGLLAQPILQQLSTSLLSIVQSGSEEARLIEGWRKQREQPSSEEADGAQEAAGHPPLESATPIETHTASKERRRSACQDTDISNVDNGSFQRTPIEEAAYSFLQRLCHRRSGTSPLGMLPDGRSVLWLQSDPSALYLRTDDDPPPNALRLLERESHCCPWGCCDGDKGKAEKRVLSFRTRSELLEHITCRHSFGSESKKIGVRGKGNFLRVSDGPMINKLCADLTGSICARCPALEKFLLSNRTSDTGEPVCFEMNELLDLTSRGRGAPKRLREIVGSSMKVGKDLCQSVRLWSRIARLFSVEVDGTFRPETAQCRTLLISSGWPTRNANHPESCDATRRKTAQSPEEWEEIERVEASGGAKCRLCSIERTTQDASARDKVSCILCSSGQDVVLRVGEPARSNETVTETEKYAGIGCALLSECCLSNESAELFNNGTPVPGSLTMVKRLLTRVASNIPSELKQKSAAQRVVSNVAPIIIELGKCQIWEDSFFAIWLAFVESSKNIRMLTQAFLLLACSIQHYKMPKWWRLSRTGWFSAYALLSSTSLSGLALQLYVFDAAVAEFASAKSSTFKKPKEHTSNAFTEQLSRLGSTEDRMALVVQWAESVGWAPYEGETDHFCDRCDDGGDLMCCEFCRTVRHPGCCSPILLEIPSHSWVCDGCIDDITVIKDT